MKSLIRCNVTIQIWMQLRMWAETQIHAQTNTCIDNEDNCHRDTNYGWSGTFCAHLIAFFHIIFIVQSPNCSGYIFFLRLGFLSVSLSISSRIAYECENVCDIWVFLILDRPADVKFICYRHELSEHSQLLPIFSSHTLNGFYSFDSEFLK